MNNEDLTTKSDLKESDEMDYQEASIKRSLRHVDKDECLANKSDEVHLAEENKSKKMKTLNDTARIVKVNNEINKVNVHNEFKFSKNNKGPFTVWITYLNSNNSKRINRIRIANILDNKYNNVITVNNKGFRNVEVICGSADEANKIIENKEYLAEYNLKVFVPGHRQFRKGIARGIPEEMDEAELMKCIKAEDIKFLDVKRLKRKTKNNKGENVWMPSETILITFEGQVLPHHVVISKCIVDIDPFVARPLKCFNCFEFGHTAVFCKKEALCVMCGNKRHEGSQCKTGLTARCTNCGKNHKSIDQSCEIFKSHFKVNVIMAYQNLTLYDAKKQVFGDNYEKAPRLTLENFPALRNKKMENELRKYSTVVKEIYNGKERRENNEECVNDRENEFVLDSEGGGSVTSNDLNSMDEARNKLSRKRRKKIISQQDKALQEVVNYINSDEDRTSNSVKSGMEREVFESNRNKKTYSTRKNSNRKGK